MPDEAEILENWKLFGRLIAPFAVLYVATQLAAARYQHQHGMPSSTEWRQGVIKESIVDANLLCGKVL